MPPKIRELWKEYTVVEGDDSKVTCNHCSKVISRGKTGSLPGRRSNSSMMAHLKAMHKDIDEARALREEDKTLAKEGRDAEKKAKDETAMAKVPIYSLQTKKQRKDFLDMSMPDTEAPQSYPTYSHAAMAKHKAVLWPIIMDGQPFSWVDSPGTNMMFRILDPQYTLHTRNFYRDLIGKIYNKSLEKLKAQVAEHNPDHINVMLDGWSAFHHGYMGVIMTYVHKWERYYLCFGVHPFDESHTSLNLATWLKELLQAWGIVDKTEVITSDTAANMKALLKYLHKDGCSRAGTDERCSECFSWGACICHILNLVVQRDLFSGFAINALIESCKSLSTFYNQSNVFASALRKAQIEVSGTPEENCLILIKDVKTRWNSTGMMLSRTLELQAPLQALMDDPHWVEKIPFFTLTDWSLMRKVVLVLQDFHDATEALSSRSASIAEVIPIINTIVLSLSTNTGDDQGVKGLKKELLAGMVKRLGHLEELEIYSVATLLHPRYKRTVFKNKDAAETARLALIRLVEEDVASTTTGSALLRESSSSSSTSSSTSSSGSVETGPSTFYQKMKRMRMEGQQELLEDSVFQASNAEAIVDDYVKSPIQDVECLSFWKSQEAGSAGNPCKISLVKLAKKFLTPAATSVDVERLFSECANVLDAKRNRTKPERVDQQMFLRKNMYLLGFSLVW